MRNRRQKCPDQAVKERVNESKVRKVSRILPIFAMNLACSLSEVEKKNNERTSRKMRLPMLDLNIHLLPVEEKLKKDKGRE